MSGTTGSRNWNEQFPIMRQLYPSLIFGERYREISIFLRNEQSVREGLRHLDAATAGMGQQACRAYLAAQEQRYGFSATLGVITDQDAIIKGSVFWTYLYRRQALVDIGAGDFEHGVLIHRLQWVLIGQWNDRMRGPLGPPSMIGELYGNLGAAHARVLTTQGRQIIAAGGQIGTGIQGQRPFNSVWDELCDAFRPRENGTVPEALWAYVQRVFPALSQRLRW